MLSSKLSRAATIDVLSDIPLLCEGVTGIGIFMVLFLVKKVCRMSVFLHASSFLSFIAATLDLSRVIVVGHRNAYDFIIAREVLLLLAYPLLNLYIWELVAECPRSEANPLIATKKRKWHSASWDRWGLPGEALKWISLATLLAVPALQLVWRLIPAERHSATYIADSVLETFLAFVFILKFLFNTYGPLSKPFWQAIRQNAAPILTLSINLGLSISNLSLFAFADSTLGRFLHSVGVYILLLYNLHSSFQDFLDSTLIDNKQRNGPVISSLRSHRKENARTVRDHRSRNPPFRSKPLPLTTPQQDNLGVKPVRSPSVKVDYTPLWVADGQDRSSSLIMLPTLRVASSTSSTFDFSTTRASTPVIRPDSPILTSSVYVQGTQQVETNPLDGLESTVYTPRDSDGSGSSSSLDEIFRHWDEVNKRIAALRELSPPCRVLYGSFNALDLLPADIPASTTPSNNSILSLSVFPDPPSNLMGFVEAVDTDTVDIITFRPSSPSFQVGRKRFTRSTSTLSAEMVRPCVLESMDTQWDVTSFIRNLTVTDPTRRVMITSMYTESGVGPIFPRTYSQLFTSPVLELCPAEGDESIEPIVE